MKPAVERAFLLFVALSLVFIRLEHLNADPPSWLSWSTGIYTDEGVYAGDARSLALFGHWSPGNFHSAEVAPLHTLLLLGVFRTFGVSLMSARLVSVACSVLALLFFYFALQRRFDSRTAYYGLYFLGFSPVFVFYNRLALLETPTVFLLCLAFYLSTMRQYQWTTGIALALAVIYKPIAVLCLPAFFTDFRSDRRACFIRAATTLVLLAMEFALWQLPYRKDLLRLNHYYLFHQYLPHTYTALADNIYRSLITGKADGVLPFLTTHSTIILLLSLVALFSKKLYRIKCAPLLATWLAVPLIGFFFMSYTPSRYFILIFPPMAALAAILISTLSTTWIKTIFVAFVIIYGKQFNDVLQSPTYRIFNAGKSLQATAPANTVLIGQYAPEIALSNNLQAIYVQPGIANDSGPVPPGLVLVTKTPFWTAYWQQRLSQPKLHASGNLTLPNHDEIIPVDTR